MVFSADVDPEKSRLLLKHLSKSNSHFKQKDYEKQELKDQIKKLKKTIKSKSYQKDLKLLEQKLSTVLGKEEEIIRKHRAREAFNRRIREKIDSLERKITNYLATKKLRDNRIEELEHEVKRRFIVEQREIELLEKQIIMLENLFEKISRDRTYSENELERVRSKISTLKERLEKVKK